MCGRLACTLCMDELRKACAYPKSAEATETTYVEPSYLEGTYHYVPLYNLCPSGVVAVLAAKKHFPEAEETFSDYLIVPMRWGMLPRWTSEHKNYHTHNARIEGAMESKFFKPEIMQNKRCVVLCDGYFEWQTTRADKQPYFLYQEKEDVKDLDMKDWSGKPLLKLAGLFSQRIDSDAVRYSCATITKCSDESLSWLHDRMPIPLESFEDVENWINGSKLKNTESLDFLLKHAESSNVKGKMGYSLKYHPVDKKYVNNSTCQSEKCIERVTVKRQNTLDNFFVKKSKK